MYSARGSIGMTSAFPGTETARYVINKKYMIVCPSFAHPALTSVFRKYKFLQVNNSFATIVNELKVLKFVLLSNGALLFS